MIQTGIFKGRVQIPYAYGRFGWTRGGGKTWHGGIDLVGLDYSTIYMPYYTAADDAQKAIWGTVTRARKVDRSAGDRTWEWGWYVCVQLDAAQTPDAVNYIYFCHCEKLLVKAGQKVVSGTPLAVMGNSGNAALNDPPYKHCHLEVRATATGAGLDPTRYSGTKNAVGTYGTAALPEPAEPPAAAQLQTITIGPVTQGDADAILAVCRRRELDKQGLYRSAWANDAKTMQTITIGPVTRGDADAVFICCVGRGLTDAGLYKSKWV